MAKLCAVIACLKIELSQRIWRRAHDEAGTIEEVDEVGVVVDTIQDEVVLLGTLAVGHKVAGAAAARVAERRGNAGGELGDVHPVTTVERRVVDRFSADHLANFAALRLKKRLLCRDGHFLRYSADMHD